MEKPYYTQPIDESNKGFSITFWTDKPSKKGFPFYGITHKYVEIPNKKDYYYEYVYDNNTNYHDWKKNIVSKKEALIIANKEISKPNERGRVYPLGRYDTIEQFDKYLGGEERLHGFKTATYGRKGHRDAIEQLENSVRKMF